MRIKYKLLTFILIPLLFILGFNSYMAQALMKEAVQIQTITMEHAFKETIYATELSQINLKIDEQSDELILELIIKDFSEAEELTDTITRLQEKRKTTFNALKEQTALHGYIDELQKLNDIEKIMNALDILELDVIQTAHNSSTSDLVDLHSKTEPIRDTLNQALLNYADDRFDEINERQAELLDLQQKSIVITWVASVMIFIIYLLLVVFFSTYFVAPIERLRNTVSEITSGNLDAEVHDKTRNDELGNLARNFEAMLTNFRGIVREKISKKFKK